MSHRFLRPLSLGLSALGLSALLASAACSSSSSSSTSGSAGASSGGPVEGPADAHCGSKVQVVSQAACEDKGAGGSTGAGGGDGGAGGMVEEVADVLYNSEGDDDDCKFHMKWSSDAIAQNKDVTFTLTLTTKGDGKPAIGAAPDIEAFLSDTHPAPNSDQKTSEGADGTYTIGPMRFDAAGKWTVRFHVYETCSDLNEDSPHGHAAFFVQVP